jgi:solute carrier family 25, member 33/36
MRQFFAGALGGTVAAATTTPLEVIKTRLQSSTSTKLPVHKMLVHILKAEGFAGLTKGLSLNIIGVGPARAIHFGSYNAYKSLCDEWFGLRGTAQHMLSGAMASMTAATFTSPLWVLKTRIQLEEAPLKGGSSPPVYTGAIQAAKLTLREEGFRGFFRGLSASYLGVTESAVQFGMYEWFRSQYLQSRESKEWHGAGRQEFPLPVAFGFGATAKLVAAMLTYPHEVLRTRLRERPKEGFPTHRSLASVCKDIVRNEGYRGFYGGITAHLMRTVPNAAILLLVVEAVSGRGL